jgi:hypothetical protein
MACMVIGYFLFEKKNFEQRNQMKVDISTARGFRER